jgi:hypothetical protein
MANQSYLQTRVAGLLTRAKVPGQSLRPPTVLRFNRDMSLRALLLLVVPFWLYAAYQLVQLAKLSG